MNQVQLVFANRKPILVAAVLLLIASVVAICCFYSLGHEQFSELNPKLKSAISTAKYLRRICTNKNSVRYWLDLMPTSISAKAKTFRRPPTYSLSGDVCHLNTDH
jgi:hypothetical protein